MAVAMLDCGCHLDCCGCFVFTHDCTKKSTTLGAVMFPVVERILTKSWCAYSSLTIYSIQVLWAIVGDIP